MRLQFLHLQKQIMVNKVKRKEDLAYLEKLAEIYKVKLILVGEAKIFCDARHVFK